MLRFIEHQLRRWQIYLEESQLETPPAATTSGWKKWRKKTLLTKPIKYFLIDEFLGELHSIIQRRAISPFYHLKSKYFTKQHYVKIDVQRFEVNKNSHDEYKLNYYTYSEPSWLMISAPFQILVDYVEQESSETHWNSNPGDSAIWDEITELYIWWIDKRQKEQDACEDLFTMPAELGLTFDTIKRVNGGEIFPDDVVKKCKQYYDNVATQRDEEKRLQQKDEDMLIRLMKIRQNLWS